MHIEHIAVWSPDIEVLRVFYARHFGCTTGKRYDNPATGFSSYFLSFSAGARFEIMQKNGLSGNPGRPGFGLAHFAVSTGSEAGVTDLTDRLRAAGVRVASEARWTGDGYFESVVLDPDGNSIEITI